ncbi:MULTISPECIES: hypothetical protein [unclassified Sporosarcina]|uniref:hypothetical protein n=1 Tax=unclassified Sporosarcina TaxID=2647733 RepID=UPI001A90E934|nr:MULTISPECIES: hypothetical protein [unclassified Sporosarcina]MBO0587602.1 hypothetical protein [Sporosarcina sp. E16_8]MBO0602409.1 hypothetical protein [Sporosarcina sp. E16_3]
MRAVVNRGFKWAIAVPTAFFLSALYNFTLFLSKDENQAVLAAAGKHLMSDGSLMQMAIYGSIALFILLASIAIKNVQHSNAERKLKLDEQKTQDLENVAEKAAEKAVQKIKDRDTDIK